MGLLRLMMFRGLRGEDIELQIQGCLKRKYNFRLAWNGGLQSFPHKPFERLKTLEVVGGGFWVLELRGFSGLRLLNHAPYLSFRRQEKSRWSGRTRVESMKGKVMAGGSLLASG